MNMNTDEERCAICLDDLSTGRRKIFVADCQHRFHACCFQRVKTPKCPCCRADVTPSPHHHLTLLRSNAQEAVEDLRHERRHQYWEVRKREHAVYKLQDKLRYAQFRLLQSKEECKTSIAEHKTLIQKAKQEVAECLESSVWVEQRQKTHELALYNEAYGKKLSSAWKKHAEEQGLVVSDWYKRQSFLQQFISQWKEAWKAQLRDNAKKKKEDRWTPEERITVKRQFVLNFTPMNI